MNLFLKVSSIAQRLGDDFVLSSDVGSVNPNSATRDQLINGIQIEVDETSNSVTISQESPGTEQVTQIIDKSAENCADLEASFDDPLIVIP
jgi:hypothetical protein